MLTQPSRRLALLAAATFGIVTGSALSVVSAQAQDAAPTVEQYEAALQELTDRRLNLAQREFYLRQQEAEIASLEARLEAATSGENEDLLPIVRNMVAEIEKSMVADLPFRVERRFALLDDLREDLRADDASAYETFRRAMDIVLEEVNYGLTVGSYVGQNPVNPGGRYAACLENTASETCDLSEEQATALANGALIEDLEDELYDGNYIHYGRMALLYLERDSSLGYRYNEETEGWDPVPASELLGLRQNVRIARGESAIQTMAAPIRLGASADAS